MMCARVCVCLWMELVFLWSNPAEPHGGTLYIQFPVQNWLVTQSSKYDATSHGIVFVGTYSLPPE
jgi:hypothetical protein